MKGLLKPTSMLEYAIVIEIEFYDMILDWVWHSK